MKPLYFTVILLLSTGAVNYNKYTSTPDIKDTVCQWNNSGSDDKIPQYPGARIIKESSLNGNYVMVFETGDQPEEVATYYKNKMHSLGWPEAMVMSAKNTAAIMINENGKQFALRAEFSNGKTRVDIVMVDNYKLPTLPDATVHSEEVTTIPESSNKNIYEQETQTSDRVNIKQQELINPPDDTMQESDQTSPFLKPEFEITDIAYWPERTRVRARVKNSGKPYEGNLECRINMTDPYSAYTFDKTVSVPVTLNTTDNEWITLLMDFTWPEPLEYPTLNLVTAVDPENKIEENNEQNNHFHKTLRVPCEINIEALSNQHLIKGMGDNFAIYGEFGSRKAGRYVYAETDYSEINPVFGLEDSRTKLYVISWNPEMVIVNVSNLGVGTYGIKFYCSDPETTEAYSSNTKQLKIERKKIKIQLFTGPFSARDMARSLAEEAEEWFRDTSTNLEEMWVEEGSPGAIVNSIFTRKPYRVVLEIYRQDFRVAYREIMEFEETEEGYALSEAFPDLGPGFYTLICKQIEYLHPDRIRHQHSFMFRLE